VSLRQLRDENITLGKGRKVAGLPTDLDTKTNLPLLQQKLKKKMSIWTEVEPKEKGGPGRRPPSRENSKSATSVLFEKEDGNR